MLCAWYNSLGLTILKICQARRNLKIANSIWWLKILINTTPPLYPQKLSAHISDKLMEYWLFLNGTRFWARSLKTFFHPNIKVCSGKYYCTISCTYCFVSFSFVSGFCVLYCGFVTFLEQSILVIKVGILYLLWQMFMYIALGNISFHNNSITILIWRFGKIMKGKY